jgi:hypothetical protein
MDGTIDAAQLAHKHMSLFSPNCMFGVSALVYGVPLALP